MGARNLSFSPILALFLAAISLCTPTVCGNAEVRVLLEIKASLDPENKFLQSWTENGDPCDGGFVGVACNEHLKVANITLQGKGLRGNVPAAVAELKCLSGLYLHYNELSGEIPKEIANLSELSDLYLNVNNLSGEMPKEIGNMASLQVLELCCNQLNGSIPVEIGALHKLNVLALQRNSLTGEIPSSIGSLGSLKMLDLSFNQLSGEIPPQLAELLQLETLYVQNNTLSGVVPSALKKTNGDFNFKDNPGLCGQGFPSLRNCSAFDQLNVFQSPDFTPSRNDSTPLNIPLAANFTPKCNQTRCPHSSKVPLIAIVAGVITASITLMVVAFLAIFRYRRRKQKIWSKSDGISEDIISVDLKDFSRRSPSPLSSHEHYFGWDSMVDGQDEYLLSFKFNLEEIESATQYFSELNLLGRSKFSAVYKGILKDRSVVAIKSINVRSCKSEESEFMKGLGLLTSLRHGNLARLRGYCCSKSRGECFLVYDFASNGSLSRYLDVVDGSGLILDWPTRVSIINGIAKGMAYLHSSKENKAAVVHRNISIEKILIDQQFNPLIIDAGLLKLLADDIVYSALKVSAALGYMAPEHITTGQFTEKSDVYAFGVIILQILSGKSNLTSSVRMAAETGNLKDLIDENLQGRFSEPEAAKLTKIAVTCTDELPECRLTMEEVIEELNKA